MDSKELIHLNKDEIEAVLNSAIRSELDIYIIDIHKNTPFLLKIGDLETIRRAIPHRTEIILEPAPPGTGISRIDKVGYLDLRITKFKYDEIFNQKQKGSIKSKKDINETERSSLYRMILGMAIQKYNYNPEATRNSATGTNKNSIKADLEASGLPLDDETIRTYLQDASEMHKSQMKK